MGTAEEPQGGDGTAGGGRTKTAARQGWATAHQGHAGGTCADGMCSGASAAREEPGKGVLGSPH